MADRYDLAQLNREHPLESHGHCPPDCEHLKQSWNQGYATAMREEYEAKRQPLVIRAYWLRLLGWLAMAATSLFIGRWAGGR